MVRKPCCDKEGLKKGPWTSEEDQKLIDYIHDHGPSNWRALPKKAGRTDNEIKNYFNTHIRKRLLRMGIDPVTHGPRLDYLDIPSIFSSLQNSSLLNMPTVLLNLQNLLHNQELLNLATSLSSFSQNEIIPHYFTQNPIINNTLVNNPYDINPQIAKQIQTFTPQSSYGLLCSSTDNNNSGFTMKNSNQSSSSLEPIVLDSNTSNEAYQQNMSNEDEIVDRYFMINDIENILESSFVEHS
ncbi:hypothetical protein RDABS01_037567 [Bienertia sinuspersici]